jgi:ribosomal protein S24E
MGTKLTARSSAHRDILHPNRANISKEELRDKLAGLYKAQKDQVNVFGLRTQFGGGKTTGFALVYDSPEAMKKFEPHFRLVRVGLATKIERASRQQRTFSPRRLESALFAIKRRRHWLLVGQLLTLLPPTQASSARTGRRPSGARRRSRAPSPRRRNKRLAFLFGVVCYSGYLAVGTMAVALCITLDCLLHPADLMPYPCNGIS